jgi:hypothetical protein
LALSNAQHAPHSGTMELRVRDVQLVKQHVAS